MKAKSIEPKESKPKPVDIYDEDRPILEELVSIHGTYKNAVSKALRFYHQSLAHQPQPSP